MKIKIIVPKVPVVYEITEGMIFEAKRKKIDGIDETWINIEGEDIKLQPHEYEIIE